MMPVRLGTMISRPVTMFMTNLSGQYDFPLLAANAVSKATGKPYFNPYTIIEKNGIKVAILGLITPAVPRWLPPELYSGIGFRDMLETAK